MKKIIFFIIILITNTVFAQSYQEAAQKALEAYYIQSGLKEQIERQLKDLERRYIPVFLVQNGSVIVFLVQSIQEDGFRISYKWEF